MSRVASSASLPGELEPQLGGLVRDLEEQLVAVHPLVRPLLQCEQPLGVQVALVVAKALRPRSTGCE